jgi:iron-sulfur cluster repair protein YtfE (RIC family)
MKIIDRETGKRLKELNKIDPVKANVSKELDGKEEESPMDPPSSYDKKVEDITVEHQVLKMLVNEHDEVNKILDKLEKAIAKYKQQHYTLDDEINTVFHEFFQFTDNELLPHNRKEEKILFPVLHRRLIENKEHGVNNQDLTAIDIMEDDHVKFIQLTTLMFNLLGLASRLPDKTSAMFTYDTFYNISKEFIELLKLHIYRENEILFPLAQKYLTTDDLNQLSPKMEQYHE